MSVTFGVLQNAAGYCIGFDACFDEFDFIRQFEPLQRAAALESEVLLDRRLIGINHKDPRRWKANLNPAVAQRMPNQFNPFGEVNPGAHADIDCKQNPAVHGAEEQE